VMLPEDRAEPISLNRFAIELVLEVKPDPATVEEEALAPLSLGAV